MSDEGKVAKLEAIREDGMQKWRYETHQPQLTSDVVWLDTFASKGGLRVGTRGRIKFVRGPAGAWSLNKLVYIYD